MFKKFSSTHICVVIILKPMSTLFFLFLKVVKPSFVSNSDDICMPVVLYLNQQDDFLYRLGTSYQLMFNTQLFRCSQCHQVTSVHSRSGRPLPDDCLAGVPCSVRSTRLDQGRGHSNVLYRLIKL